MIIETVDLLGRNAIDRLTEFSGVITSVSFDISGCVQAWVSPPAKDGAELRTGSWFDVQRLSINYDGNKMMQAPDFDANDRLPHTHDLGPIHKSDPNLRGK